MVSCNRAAAVGIGGLSLFFAWSAARLFYGIATGHLSENGLFGVATCCDIPQSEIVSNATSTAIPLAIAAYLGRWLAVGVWRERPYMARGTFVWLALVLGSQIGMASGMVPEVQGQHYALAFLSAMVGALTLPLALSKPVKVPPSPDDAPIASPHG